MFDFFRKKGGADKLFAAAKAPVSGEQEAAIRASIRSAIEKQKPTDPLIGPRMGAKQLHQVLISGLKNEKGVHIESFLTVLGALAGFSCQMSLREGEVKGEMVEWAIADGADGKKYYFGDALNKPLAENQYSIWSLVAGATQHLGAAPPDINGIFQHVAATVGGEAFGIPRIPEKHRPGDTPLNYLKVIWPKIYPGLRPFYDEPRELPILFALAVQEAIFMGKDVIKPTLAATIIMECAVPMSKVDLPEFHPFSP